MKADSHTRAEVEAAITSLTDAYKERRLNDVMACIAPDADVVLYGTGADEKRVGPDQVRAQVERDWAQTESIEMSYSWKSISAAGPVAWAALDGAFKIRAGGQSMELPVRVTLVLEKRGNRWLIVHSHFSTPAAGQAPDSSF